MRHFLQFSNGRSGCDIIYRLVRLRLLKSIPQNDLNDKNLKNTISNNCIKQIADNYTWDKLADKFLKVYSKISIKVFK